LTLSEIKIKNLDRWSSVNSKDVEENDEFVR